MNRIVENLSPEDQARLLDCIQQSGFAFVQLAELYRRGAAGLTLTGEEYATLDLLQKMASMFSSGMFPSKETMPTETAIRIGREIVGADH